MPDRGADREEDAAGETLAIDPKCDTGAAAWRVYLLRCADGTLYTGVTRDLPRRLRQHNGEIVGGARYTRSRRPVELLWYEVHTQRGDAQRAEARIKGLPRRAKLQLSRQGPPAPPGD
jgi:putative endonuclease